MDKALVPCKEQYNASESCPLGSLRYHSEITFRDSTSSLDRPDPNLWPLRTSRLAGHHKRMDALLTSSLPISGLPGATTAMAGHPEYATQLGKLTWKERQIGTGPLERVEKRGFVDG